MGLIFLSAFLSHRCMSIDSHGRMNGFGLLKYLPITEMIVDLMSVV